MQWLDGVMRVCVRTPLPISRLRREDEQEYVITDCCSVQQFERGLKSLFHGQIT